MKDLTGNTVDYRRQNWKGWHDPAKVLGKEGQCVLIRHGRAFNRMHPCHLMKANEFGSPKKAGNKEMGSPRNEGYKTAKNEINEVLGEDEEQHNKSLHINKEELKDNSKKNIVEHKIK